LLLGERVTAAIVPVACGCSKPTTADSINSGAKNYGLHSI
jgi:hypothetical protein